MTRKLTVIVFSCATLVFGARNTTAADRVQAGEWETKLTLGSGEPMLTKYCITAADAASMNGDLATLRKYLEESTETNTGGMCKVKNVALNGNRTIVTIACGETEVVGTTTYHGDRFEASSSDGSTATGKRIGACPSSKQ
jgi:hypothetical protein